jgi:hypothetical protein
MTTSEIVLGIYRSEYTNADEAMRNNALHIVPSTWTYTDYTGLADLLDVLSTAGRCAEGDSGMFKAVQCNPDGTFQDITWEALNAA